MRLVSHYIGFGKWLVLLLNPILEFFLAIIHYSLYIIH